MVDYITTNYICKLQDLGRSPDVQRLLALRLSLYTAKAGSYTPFSVKTGKYNKKRHHRLARRQNIIT